MKILLLSRYGRLGAASRLRFFQYLPLLRQAGLECTVQPLLDDDMLSGKYGKGSYALAALLKVYSKRIAQMMKRHRFDLIWIEKEALPWLPVFFERFLLRGVPYVLDYDDAWFHNYDLHRSRWIRQFFGQRLDKLMAGARLVVCGNDYLARRAKDAGAAWVEVLPTVIDRDRYTPQPAAGHGQDVPRIVWIGSPPAVHYLKVIHQPLLALRESCRFTLRVIGAQVDLPGVDVEYIDWSEQTEASSIQTCQVGVMPLQDSPWERGKCGYKLIQYMACGLPVVASPVGVNSLIVRENVNGFLAGDDEQWVTALSILLRDDALRQRMGCAGRVRVEDEYCIQQAAPRLIQWLKSAGEHESCGGLPVV